MLGCGKDACIDNVTALNTGQTITCTHEDQSIRIEGVTNGILIYCECPRTNKLQKTTDTIAVQDAGVN